jgi:hypothetical protein
MARELYIHINNQSCIWEYKLILRFFVRESCHLKEALRVFGAYYSRIYGLYIIILKVTFNMMCNKICPISICIYYL